MDAKNLTWEQIKELVQVAMDNQNEFHLDISKDGDVSIEIHKPCNLYYPITTTTSGFVDTSSPTQPITINTPLDDKQNWKPYVWCGDHTVMPDDYTRIKC